ncbi:MAG: oxidoreductase [Pseudorhodoplanes sp.]|nr:MAG: oxidoreductase [Sphingopyxis terrae]MBV6488409.1 Pyrogallol hydroxytransferase small subunit [Pseudorhodoplanes sp.]MBW7948448.1 oxidoreductase [Pseudorhodoplanes sp.]GIK80332.1 MAG: oxidoreductase [Alphaproteobacteria bacterium]
MQKWNLVFDIASCTGCHNCTIAVQDEYVGNDFPGYAAEMPRHGHRWVEIERCERGRHPAVDLAYMFRACQHCDDPPCLRAAHTDAVRKRPDGIVVIDPQRARGQKQIVDACPYHAVVWNEGLQLPQHWNFDAHLIDAGWNAPRPVQACPTGALRALKVTDDEMGRVAAAEGLERLEMNRICRPRVYYRNLYRVTRVFAGGTLLTNRDGMETCVAGARVRLLRRGDVVGEARSDSFGDFRFDALDPFSGEYRIEVTADGCHDYVATFELGESHWLGEIRLDAA